MTRFDSVREAKEYLAGKIATEAERVGKPLSEVERKMLYAGKTGWTPPDMAEVQDAFDRYHDAAEYEARIAELIRAIRAKESGAGPQESECWKEAVRWLGADGHYLVALDAGAEATPRPHWDMVKRILTAAAIFGASLAIAYWFHRGQS